MTEMTQGTLVQISRSGGGLPKYPVAGPVRIGFDGVDEDCHRNLKYHGGPDKAVLMIAEEVLNDLAAKGFRVYAGALGENLTVRGLDPRNWRAGQRYRVGDATIELTTLREPCLQLDPYGPAIKAELHDARCRHGDTGSLHWARGGFYARVLHGGIAMAGAPVVLESDAC